jgi:hypothetical protein
MVRRLIASEIVDGEVVCFMYSASTEAVHLLRAMMNPAPSLF